MKLSEFAERYIFVRKCAGCGELIGYDEREDAFCTSCRISWERAKADGCSLCGHSMIECDCMPKTLSAAGLPFLKKLVAYRAEDAQKAENRVIYFLKRNKNKRVARFMALQLREKLSEIFDELEMDKNGAVLTFLPRSRKAYAEYGFDQSELVCRELSRIAEVEILPLFVRKRGSSAEQKKLNSKQRGANASAMFELDRESFEQLGERAVVVFDDVVTSGASMAEAVKLLRRKKVRDIYGWCISLTQSENKSSQ